MIKIFAANDNSEIEIVGSHEALRYLETTLKYVSTSIEVLADQSVDPFPYEKMLASLQVFVTNGPTCVSVANNDLLVCGSKSNLQKFASFFQFDASANKGSHTHFVYCGTDAVHPSSIPLVIAIDV